MKHAAARGSGAPNRPCTAEANGGCKFLTAALLFLLVSPALAVYQPAPTPRPTAIPAPTPWAPPPPTPTPYQPPAPTATPAPPAPTPTPQPWTPTPTPPAL